MLCGYLAIVSLVSQFTYSMYTLYSTLLIVIIYMFYHCIHIFCIIVCITMYFYVLASLSPLITTQGLVWNQSSYAPRTIRISGVSQFNNILSTRYNIPIPNG